MPKRSLFDWLRNLRAGEELPGEAPPKKRVPFTSPHKELDDWLKWLRDTVDEPVNRKRKYKEYERMDEKSIEVSAALTMYANDATAIDWNSGTNLWIESRDNELKRIGEELFDALDMPNTLWAITRDLCKYGNNFERLIFPRNNKGIPLIGPGNTYGISQTRWANPKYIDRVENRYAKLMGFFDSDPWHHKVTKDMVKKGELDPIFQDAKVSSKRKPWDIVHFRLLGKDRASKYGTAMIEEVRVIWKYIDLVTEVLMVTRLSRAPSRKVFYVDVGDSTGNEEAWEIIRFWKQMLKKDHWINPHTREFRSLHDPRSPSEDLFWPVRGQKSASRVEEWPGLVDVKEMADVDLLWTRLFAGLKIPPQYFGFSLGGNALSTPNTARTLTLQDLRYARSVGMVQIGILMGLHRMLDIHFSLLGMKKDRFKGAYNVRLAEVSTDEEYQRNEILSSKLSQAAQWADLVDRLEANKGEVLQFVLSKILRLPNKDVKKIATPPPPPPEAMQQPGQPQPGQPGMEQQPPQEDIFNTPETKEFRTLIERIGNDKGALKELVREMSRAGRITRPRIYDDDPLPMTGANGMMDDDIEGD